MGGATVAVGLVERPVGDLAAGGDEVGVGHPGWWGRGSDLLVSGGFVEAFVDDGLGVDDDESAGYVVAGCSDDVVGFAEDRGAWQLVVGVAV